MQTIDSATIAAIATPPGIGGIGVIRISGDDAAAIAQRVFRATGRKTPELTSSPSHRLYYGKIIDPQNRETIDEVLLSWMKGPHTYTREDTVEISCHGGPVPLRETLRVVIAAGARPAERGEFTLRAFLNGRLDLTQAESVLEVIGAKTSESLRLAVDDLGGQLRDRLKPATDALVHVLAYLDASADFPDDEIETSDVDDGLAQSERTLADVVKGAATGMLYREGVQIALVGRPNVGKSSLLNALLRSDRSIVTPIAGTTRDVIRETISLEGIPATLLDTAGIVESDDPVEQIGVERSRQALATSAAVVLVLDGAMDLQPEDEAIIRTLADRPADQRTPAVIVRNKRDLASRLDVAPIAGSLSAPVVDVSSVTGDGITTLEERLVTLLTHDAGQGAAPAMINARQRAALNRALAHLHDAQDARSAGIPQDLLATSVRAALHAVGEVTGQNVDEDVLAEIFSSFCIGK